MVREMSESIEIRDLIEISIISNSYYSGNNDLYQDFYNESFDRLKKSITALGGNLPPKNYIDKITNTVILKVLKETGRLTRRKPQDVDAPIERSLSYNINDYGEIDFNTTYPNSERENSSIICSQLTDLIRNLEKLNENEPEKHFIRLFELKYDKRLKMSEIAPELNISEQEAIHRYFEMITKLNSYY